MLLNTSVAPASTPGNRSGIYVTTNVPAANTTNLNEIRGIFSYTTMAGSGNAGGINGARLYGEHGSSGSTTEVNGSLMGAGAAAGTVTTLNAAHGFALNYGSTITNMTGNVYRDK